MTYKNENKRLNYLHSEIDALYHASSLKLGIGDHFSVHMGKEIRNKICIPSEIEKTNNSAAIHMAEKTIPQIMLCNQKNIAPENPDTTTVSGFFRAPIFKCKQKDVFLC